MLEPESTHLLDLCASWYVPHPHHVKGTPLILTALGYSILTDLICSLLPILVVYNVQIPLRKKIGICLLMSLGLVATACAAVRASSLGTTVTDLSYDYCIAAFWANTELHLGIIAANLAISQSIFAYFFGNKHWLGSKSRDSGANGRVYDGYAGNDSKCMGYGYPRRDRTGYIRSRSNPDPMATSTTVTNIGRGLEWSDSELEMVNGIQKTTEVSVVESEGSALGRWGDAEHGISGVGRAYSEHEKGSARDDEWHGQQHTALPRYEARR
jgi:hypothetical protein